MPDSYAENTLRYYPERCINCRRCTQVCPHGVFAEGQEQAELALPGSLHGVRGVRPQLPGPGNHGAKRCRMRLGDDQRRIEGKGYGQR